MDPSHAAVLGASTRSRRVSATPTGTSAGMSTTGCSRATRLAKNPRAAGPRWPPSAHHAVFWASGTRVPVCSQTLAAQSMSWPGGMVYTRTWG